MLPIHKRKMLFFLALAILAMLILESGISNMALSRGESFSWQIPELLVSTGLNLRPIGQDNLLLIFFVVAVISIFLTREGRKRLLLLILGTALVTFILYYYKPNLGGEPTGVVSQVTAPAPAEEVVSEALYPAPPPAEVFEPNTPDWLITFVGVGISLTLAVSLVALLWMALHYRLKGTRSFSQAFSEEVQAAIDALEAGLELKDAISRCYAQMSRLLQEERGLVRGEDMTPREFEQLLTQKGFPAEPVRALTRLFEDVRYGHLNPGENGVQTALTSLSSIRDHCQALKLAES